jgi:hypothetical protein
MTSSSNRPATTTVTTDDSEARTPALDLSFTKITGGALAAVTTAVAASKLGVNGTLTGAAFGSIVSSIASALYAASLKTAHTRIRTTRTVVTGRGVAGAGDPEDPAAVPAEHTGHSASLPGETLVLPAAEGHPSAGSVPPYPGHLTPPPRRERRIPWKSVSIMAGLVFVVAMGAIFVTEVLIGHPISNSQESGTSVSRVVQRDIAPATETEESPSPSESSSASESPSESVSTTTGTLSPTDSASLAPGETTQPGDTATTQPTASGQTATDGQSQSQPAAPTGSAAAGAATDGAAAVQPSP